MSEILPLLRRASPKTPIVRLNNAELFYICQLLKVFFFPFFFFFFPESMKIHGSDAAPVNQRLLISPVESVGDDVVVHKLPSPAEFNRDVELENTEADRSETRGRTPLF